jgi:hypothetical protein
MAVMISSRRSETGKPSGNSIFKGCATRTGAAAGINGDLAEGGCRFGDEFGKAFGKVFGAEFGFKGLDKTGDNLGDNPQLSQPSPAGTLITPTRHVRCF